MSRAVAVNVAANTNEPGFRGPVFPDGSFRYVPIPEAAETLPSDEFPVDERVPTYGDLDVPFSLPADIRETPVHMDPEFPGVHGRTAATYGDPYSIKAGPIAGLEPGDWLLFYATLSLRPADWQGPVGAGRSAAPDPAAVDDDLPPEWGVYLFAGLRVDRVLDTTGRDGSGGGTVDRDASDRGTVDHDASDRGTVDRDAAAALTPTNAHLKRDPFDARVVVDGDPTASGLFDRVVPLSTPEAGTEANRLVVDLSSDSGKGPWWRRPMRFDEAATATLLDRIDVA